MQQHKQQVAVERLTAAKQKAVSQFWALLQDVVALAVALDHWCVGLPADHPVLRVEAGEVTVHQTAIPAQQGGI